MDLLVEKAKPILKEIISQRSNIAQDTKKDLLYFPSLNLKETMSKEIVRDRILDRVDRLFESMRLEIEKIIIEETKK